LEPLAWCIAAVIAVFAQLPGQRLPLLYDDSFQYLSAAHELGSSHRMATSLVHFDTERSHGTIPAPLTWFPPGYPLAIALVSSMGLSYERAALAVSVACFALTAVGLWYVVRMLDPARWTARAAVILWLMNSHAVACSASALSESMFTFFSLAILFFLLKADNPASPRHGVWWFGMAVAAGISYWVRYAGLLWVVSCVVVLLAGLMVGHPRRPSWRTVAVVGMSLVALLAPLMARNMALTGDWRGGNNTPTTVPVLTVAGAFPGILFHLLLGDSALGRLWLALLLMAAGLAGAIALGPGMAKGRGFDGKSVWAQMPIAKLGIAAALLVVYSGGIAAIALRSPITFMARMYIPVLPYIIVLSTCAIAALSRHSDKAKYSRGLTISLVLLAAGYVEGNQTSRSSIPPDSFERVNAALRLPDRAGFSVKERLDEKLTASEVIAATDGQAAGYIMNHPTLSLVGHQYTRVNWDEEKVRAELGRFRASYLLVFRDPALAPVVRESRFLDALAAGRAPDWLRLDDFNAAVCLYRIADTSTLPATSLPTSSAAGSGR
jgi:hypothetical protein